MPLSSAKSHDSEFGHYSAKLKSEGMIQTWEIHRSQQIKLLRNISNFVKTMTIFNQILFIDIKINTNPCKIK